MHYLLYGTGMQTWEYSPLFAIRSYAYLWLHALPACLHAHVLQTNKVTTPNLLSLQRLLLFSFSQACVMIVLQVLVFYFVRCVLAFSCCVCELYFYKWVYTPVALACTFGAIYIDISITLWFVCVSHTGQFVKSLVCMWDVLCWHSSSWARECSARLLVGHIYSLV